MTERKQGLLLLAAFLLGCIAVSQLIGPNSAPFVILALFGIRNAHASRRIRRGRDALAQLLAALRSQDAASREETLEQIKSPMLRGYLREVLAADGSDEKTGDVEYFPFPKSLQRRYSRLYWAAITVGLIVLSLAVFTGAARAARTGGVILGLGAVVLAWYASRRHNDVSTVIEVTPFRITERGIDGATKTLMLSRYLELRTDPQRNRAVLSAGQPDPGIVLDYRRMGFDRLAELVLKYGDFARPESIDPAS